MESAAILDFAVWKKRRDFWEGTGAYFKKGP